MQSIDSDTQIRLSLTLRSKDPKRNSAGPSQSLPAKRPEVPARGFGSDGRETERSHRKKKKRVADAMESKWVVRK